MSSHRVLICVAVVIVLALAAVVYVMYGPAWGLSRAQDRWQDSRPDSYDMTVAIRCLCPWSGTWDVSVDGEEVDVVPPPHAKDIGWREGDEEPTIDVLYGAVLRRANSTWWPSPFSRPVTSYSVDAEGVPREVWVDQWGVIDEEFGWTIERFEAQSSPS